MRCKRAVENLEGDKPVPYFGTEYQAAASSYIPDDQRIKGWQELALGFGLSGLAASNLTSRRNAATTLSAGGVDREAAMAAFSQLTPSGKGVVTRAVASAGGNPANVDWAKVQSRLSPVDVKVVAPLLAKVKLPPTPVPTPAPAPAPAPTSPTPTDGKLNRPWFDTVKEWGTNLLSKNRPKPTINPAVSK